MRKYLQPGAIALAALAATPALAEFPMDGDVTFVIPYNPGGGLKRLWVQRSSPRTSRVPLARAAGKRSTGLTPMATPSASSTSRA